MTARPSEPRAPATGLRPTILNWLLDGDPAIRYQVLRDLTDASPEAVATERSRIAKEGWAAELLSRQSRNGRWGGEDRGLMITLWSLTVLKDLGLDPQSPQARKAVARVQKLRFKEWDNRPFFTGEVEPCINGRILGLGAYFTKPDPNLLDQLLSEQLPDGGWNCEAPKSKVSSFHTTICVLEGLLDYERAAGKSARLTKARRRAENYLLDRRLFRSLRTGEIIDKKWLRFAYPPIWHYDVLRALDYFRQARKPDPRMKEAIDIVVKRRHQNSRWPLNLLHPEKIPLEMETEVARASRWNTLRALRVLRWYNASI